MSIQTEWTFIVVVLREGPPPPPPLGNIYISPVQNLLYCFSKNHLDIFLRNNFDKDFLEILSCTEYVIFFINRDR